MKHSNSEALWADNEAVGNMLSALRIAALLMGGVFGPFIALPSLPSIPCLSISTRAVREGQDAELPVDLTPQIIVENEHGFQLPLRYAV